MPQSKKNPTNLQKRGGVWWFRMRVPRDVKSQFVSEFLWSLKTGDKAEAIRLRDLRRLDVQQRVDEARALTNLGRQGPDSASRRVPAEDEALGLVERWLSEASDYYKTVALEDLDKRLRLMGYVYWNKAEKCRLADAFTMTNEVLRAAGFDDYPSHTFQQGIEGKVKFHKGLPAPPVVKAMRLYMNEAINEARKRLLQRLEPATVQQLNPVFANLAEIEASRLHKKIKVKELVAEYRRQNSSPSNSRKTALKHEANDNIIQYILGPDRPVAEIKRADMRLFRDIMAILPANHTKRFPGVKYSQFLEMDEKVRGKPMAAITANGYLSNFEKFLDYAHKEDILAVKPASLQQLKDATPRLRRRPFRSNELNAIFKAPLYMGCINDEEAYNRPGNSRPRRHRFWLPILLMYTGARTNEICQLTCDDIQTKDGIHVFNLRFDLERNKRLKNNQSQRLVPIHSDVVAMGFLRYVDRIRLEHGDRSFIFPSLPSGSTGYRSESISRWFSRFMDHCGMPDPTICLHSMRHTFRDRMRAGGVSRDRCFAIAGWTEGPASGDKYGGEAFVPAMLALDMEKASFSDVDLRHLFETP